MENKVELPFFFEMVNSGTKRQKEISAEYLSASETKAEGATFTTPKITIWDAYERPSEKKVAIYSECEALKAKFNGYGSLILGASKFFFSYAFLFHFEGKTYICKVTKSKKVIAEFCE